MQVKIDQRKGYVHKNLDLKYAFITKLNKQLKKWNIPLDNELRNGLIQYKMTDVVEDID